MLDMIINEISNIMYSYLLIILLLAVGLYFTFRTKFIQFRMFAESIRVVGEKPDKAGSISSFQALMVSTASRVGTGNIIGISTASHREQLDALVDSAMTIPEVNPMFLPSLEVIPMQLFAYYVALMRGCDIDKPRNLAKSVTVE